MRTNLNVRLYILNFHIAKMTLRNFYVEKTIVDMILYFIFAYNFPREMIGGRYSHIFTLINKGYRNIY